MALHKDVSSTDVHVINAYTYATAVARGAATGFVAADVGKVALQSDENSFWVLVATTPTWAFLGRQTVLASGSFEAIDPATMTTRTFTINNGVISGVV